MPRRLVIFDNDPRPVQFDQAALIQLRHQTDQQRGIFADALHLHQFLHRRTEHAVKAAETTQQRMGHAVGIHPWNGVIQQQLQCLVRRKGIQPMPAELLFLALAVPRVGVFFSLHPLCNSLRSFV